MDKYDRLTDKLERIGDTYQLYYGEDSYEEILSLMQQQGDTMKSQLDQLTNAYQH
jgi:gas vesicle protein